MTDDATTQQVEAIVKAAIAWRGTKDDSSLMERAEWALYTAVNHYGTRYKGVQGPDTKPL
jgi:predicted signal transduction protein with EAL and GGDEF domain